ncbi:MAG: response regulator [Proteobacteria bacterium]|nr:response regulator [Pseudomonadota bacterium]MBU1641629.1 response regulator [Pseudomonadota bacterium]
MHYNSGGGFSHPEYLQEILASSKRAAKLVKRILAFSRKAEIVECTVFDINTELEHAITLLEKTIPREISIEKDLSPDIGLIRGDAGQFEQVLLNLGANAKHAMPDGGRLTIKTEQVTITTDQPSPFPDMKPGEYVQLTVSDTGHGMDTETLAQIFNPFFTTKGVGAGTGLGLAIVYGIVKGHHGYIGCVSEPKKGTIFQIFLPVAAENAHPSAQPALRLTPRPVGQQETVLLVDDESSLLAIGKTMLEDNGYQVLQANSGEEALALFETQGKNIDLILLDVSMPGMGGHRCLKALLELKPTAKILLTSGYSLDESLEAIIASGACGFVAKPYSQQDLLQAIHVALVG